MWKSYSEISPAKEVNFWDLCYGVRRGGIYIDHCSGRLGIQVGLWSWAYPHPLGDDIVRGTLLPPFLSHNPQPQIC